MMLARCPACQTVFRVRPEQLRAHRGEVRCGRCQAPFNALEHLLETDAGAPGLETPATAAPSTEAGRRENVERAFGRTPPADHARPADNFFILEERPAEAFTGGSAHAGGQVPPPAPSWERADRRDDEATASADQETQPPEYSSVGTGSTLDFEIPDRLLVPRRPLRTSDLLRREPAVGEPSIEPPPGTEPAIHAAEVSFPEFIDLSDFGPPTSPAINFSESELPDAERRVPFDEWAQRVRSEGGDRSETGPGPALPADEGGPEPEHSPPELSREPEATISGPSTDSAPAFADEADRRTIAPETDATATLNAAPAAADAAAESARLDAAYGPPPASAAKRALVGVGVGLLLGVLGVQAAYLFRAEITREWPQLRPAYLAACEALGCTVSLPREADLVGIATSDLQSEPGGAGRFILNATVRNRAPYPQAYPHLELTLTDAQDRPVIRRVLEPKEWVPPRQLQRAAIADGFPAGSEVAVRVLFEAEDVAAVGYRLYVFYP